MDPQGSRSCSAPSSWSCVPSLRCGEVSSCILFRKPGSFLFRVSKQGPCFTAVEEDGDDKRLIQRGFACEADGAAPPVQAYNRVLMINATDV